MRGYNSITGVYTKYEGGITVSLECTLSMRGYNSITGVYTKYEGGITVSLECTLSMRGVSILCLTRGYLWRFAQPEFHNLCCRQQGDGCYPTSSTHCVHYTHHDYVRKYMITNSTVE